jgi:hypothetical protein
MPPLSKNKGGERLHLVLCGRVAFILDKGTWTLCCTSGPAPSTRVAYWGALGRCDQHHENSLLPTTWQRSSATARGYNTWRSNGEEEASAPITLAQEHLASKLRSAPRPR